MTPATQEAHGVRTSAASATSQRVIDLILAGDVFQTNIAQRFSAKLSTSFDPLAF
jgi:anthranilate/para-aminobenzoate synthase component I